MSINYKVGKNRYKTNGYFVYKIEDAIINKSKSFNFISPIPGSIVLFCSNVGGSELVKFLSYDKLSDEVCLQFMDDKTSFKFNVSGSEVFIQWGETMAEDPIVLDFISNKDQIFTKTVLQTTKENIIKLNQIKEIYLKNKDPNLLKELNDSIDSLQSALSDLANIEK